MVSDRDPYPGTFDGLDDPTFVVPTWDDGRAVGHPPASYPPDEYPATAYPPVDERPPFSGRFSDLEDLEEPTTLVPTSDDERDGDDASETSKNPIDIPPPSSRAAAAGRMTRKSRRKKGKRRGLGFARETAIILVSALFLSWLIKTFLMQAFFIPSQSMENTLSVGDRVMVSRLVPRFLDINRGDVVVFTDPGNWLDPHVAPDRGPILNAVTTSLTWVGLLPQDSGEHLIKRVIGTPGDTVACCTPFEFDDDGNRIGGGLVTVNGVPIDETLYLRPGVEPSLTEFEAAVPEGHLFVMGDNRSNSGDSRYHLEHNPATAFVPIDDVVGTAFVTVWPFGNWTWHRNPGSVFEHVPDPQ